MRQLICDFFNENPGHPYNYKQVSRAVNAKNDPQKIMISQILAELAAELYLTEVDPGRYKYDVSQKIREGVLSVEVTERIMLFRMTAAILYWYRMKNL